MGAILRLIHMDTTLQGPMFMPTHDPMFMRIHIGIMAPTIPTEAQVEPHAPPRDDVAHVLPAARSHRLFHATQHGLSGWLCGRSTARPLHGLTQVAVDPETLAADLDTSWAVLAEAVQTVMRKHGCMQPYEQLKTFTRGRAMTRQAMQAFIRSPDLPEDEKARLLWLTPATHTGRASQLVRHMEAVPFLVPPA